MIKSHLDKAQIIGAQGKYGDGDYDEIKNRPSVSEELADLPGVRAGLVNYFHKYVDLLGNHTHTHTHTHTHIHTHTHFKIVFTKVHETTGNCASSLKADATCNQ